MTCSHEWRSLTNMTGHRTNDGSFYCMNGYNWCRKCGALGTTFQKLPYEKSENRIEHPLVTGLPDEKIK